MKRLVFVSLLAFFLILGLGIVKAQAQLSIPTVPSIPVVGILPVNPPIIDLPADMLTKKLEVSPELLSCEQALNRFQELQDSFSHALYSELQAQEKMTPFPDQVQDTDCTIMFELAAHSPYFFYHKETIIHISYDVMEAGSFKRAVDQELQHLREIGIYPIYWETIPHFTPQGAEGSFNEGHAQIRVINVGGEIRTLPM